MLILPAPPPCALRSFFFLQDTIQQAMEIPVTNRNTATKIEMLVVESEPKKLGKPMAALQGKKNENEF